MIGSVLLGALSLGLFVAVIMVGLRRSRAAQLVSPILLDEALDPDLLKLCRRLRRAGWLTPARRRELGGQLLLVAAHRQSGDSSSDDRRRLELVREATRR